MKNPDRAPRFPLVGLSRERRQLEGALRRGESTLVLGAPGSGKTALVQFVTASIERAVYMEYCSHLHDMLAARQRLWRRAAMAGSRASVI